MEIKIDNFKQQEKTEALNHNHKPQFPTYKLLVIMMVLSFVFGFSGGYLALAMNLKIDVLSKKPNPTKNIGSSENTIRVSEDSSVIDVVKKASPAVVSIVITKDISRFNNYQFDPFSDDFFFPFQRQIPKSTQPNIQEVGAGTGFFISADGMILTNKHVVSDSEASYTVVTSDGKKYEAKTLAIDSRNDIALIKIDATNVPFLEFANSSDLQIGQKVVAIGNSLGQYQNTVTSGIVSGIGRSITAGGSSDDREQLEGVIQTDAAINPGNSGGPLLNIFGQVIGMNTAVDRGGQLVGFAIPSNDLSKAVKSYEKNKKIVRPYLGVRYVMLNKQLSEQEKLPKDFGALVLRGEKLTDFAVIPGSPADKAGIVENDIILEVNGKVIDEKYSLSQSLKDKDVGDKVEMKIYHKGSEKNISVVLEEAK